MTHSRPGRWGRRACIAALAASAALAANGCSSAAPAAAPRTPEGTSSSAKAVAASRSVHVSRTPGNATVLAVISPTLDSLGRTETQLGARTGIVSVFADFTQDFPQAAAQAAQARDVPLMISWEPWNSSADEKDQPAYALASIIDGSWDTYMSRFLLAAGRAGQTGIILMRFAPEMNGDWRPWSTGVNGNRDGQYVQAWRHVRELASRLGVKDLVWVWNPAIDYEGASSYAQLYPGDRYVDYLALDGYNWGSSRPWGWQSYQDIFAPSVAQLKALAGTKPWGIAETGSAESPGDKAKWLQQTYAAARADGAAFIAWFDYDKETDWRMSQRADTRQAWQDMAFNEQNWASGEQDTAALLGISYTGGKAR